MTNSSVRALAIGATLLLTVACSSPAEDDADPATDDVAPATEATDVADPEGDAAGDPETSATEPAAAEPAATEPADTGSADTEPADTEPADTGAASGPATLDPVTVAVMYPDLSVAAQFGLAEEVGEFGPVFEALIADANERGGIAGHQIDLELVEFDLLVDGDSVRACLTATQDLDAFVVIGLGGVYGDPVVCVAEQNETLMLQADGSPDEFYERADGRLFTLTPSKGETQVAIVEAFDEQLAAAPFAVFSSIDTGGDHDTMEAYLLPALAEAGLEPAVTVVLDSDGDVAASQIPVEVEEVRAAGVETIISTAGFFSTASFAQALEAQGIDVQWVGSDAAGFASDLYASQIDPAQLDGARGVTTHTFGWEAAGLDEPEADAACRARAGELLGTEIEVGSIDIAGAFYACNFADLLVAAGEQVEGDLTTESLAAALQRVTDIALADYGPAGFGEGDFTAANAVREITWSAACSCWSAVGDFAPLDGG